jgi:hypothetical protein
MFDWAKFRTAKGGVKIHTCLDVELMLPDVVNISEAKISDRHGLKQLIFPKNTIVVEDRGYFDFTLMLNRIAATNVFITRIKNNTVYETIEELDLPEDKNEHIVKDEIIRLTSIIMHKSYYDIVLLHNEKCPKKLKKIASNNLKVSIAFYIALFAACLLGQTIIQDLIKL